VDCYCRYGRPQTWPALDQLALPANLACHVDGRDGRHPKDVQGQMRHSRISTAMDIYAQFVPESQRRALAKMSAMVESRTSKPVAATASISMPSQSRMVN